MALIPLYGYIGLTKERPDFIVCFFVYVAGGSLQGGDLHYVKYRLCIAIYRRKQKQKRVPPVHLSKCILFPVQEKLSNSL
jgi:hypothetical protein